MDQFLLALAFTFLGALLAAAVGWWVLRRRLQPPPARMKPVPPPVAAAPVPDISHLIDALARERGMEHARVAQVVRAALALEREINASQGAMQALIVAFDALCDTLAQQPGRPANAPVSGPGAAPAEAPAPLASPSKLRVPPAVPAPLAKTTAPAPIPPSTPPASAPRSGAAAPLVLVVDDSLTVRAFAQRLLRSAGYRVSMAEDGVEALERLRQERPSVVLADIEMPRMDGFELARHIRADSTLAGVPIIMITSHITDSHQEMARQIGANHCLGKPYTPEAMLQLVRRYALPHVAAASTA